MSFLMYQSTRTKCWKALGFCSRLSRINDVFSRSGSREVVREILNNGNIKYLKKRRIEGIKNAREKIVSNKVDNDELVWMSADVISEIF